MEQSMKKKGKNNMDIFGKSQLEPAFSHSRAFLNQRNESGTTSRKRPKLEIFKNVNLLSSNSSTVKTEDEVTSNEDLWEDFDIDEKEIHQIDETIALSQVNNVSKAPQRQLSENEHILSATTSNENGKDFYDLLCNDESIEISKKQHKKEAMNLKQIPGNTESQTGAKAQVSHLPQRNSEVKYQSEYLVKQTKPWTKSTPGRLPFRRVASSGWPPSFDSSCSSSSSIESDKHRKVPIGKNNLHGDFEQLRLENERLEGDLLKNRGEITFLRGKMKQLQTEKDKMERVMLGKVNDLKSEAERTCSSYLKEIRSLQGQLEVKEMELKSAEQKRQHLNSVDRINPEPSKLRFKNISGDFQNKSELSCMYASSQLKRTQKNHSLDLIKAIIPDLLQPSQPEDPIFPQGQINSSCNLFSGQIELVKKKNDRDVAVNTTGTLAPREIAPALEKKVKLHCTAIQMCGTLLSDLQDLFSIKAHCIISQVLNICNHILTDLFKQLESTLKLGNGYIERERELLQKCYKKLPLNMTYNLLNHKAFYHDERGICARRALGLLSVLIEVSDFAAEQILSRENKELHCNSSNNLQHSSDILIIIRDIVFQIDYQRRAILCQGVLAGVMAFIEKMLKTNTIISIENQMVVVDILRWVVFSRPGNLVIYNILKAMLAAMKYPYIINGICCNSEEKTYQESFQQGLIQFTPETCILQILCWQIQIAETPQKHLMSDICVLWLFSLLSAGHSELCPTWLYSESVQKSCQCQTLILQTNFFLLSKACFICSSANDDDEKKQIEKLLTNGVHLVYNLMTENDHLMAKMNHHTLCFHEHFLHSMKKLNDAINLDENTRRFLDVCVKEQESHLVNINNGNANKSLFIEQEINSYFVGKDGIQCQDILDGLDNF